MFREDKATAMASYFLDRKGTEAIEVLDLMKFLYAAERLSIMHSARQITGDTFVSMKLGPVLSNTLRCAKGQAEASAWAEHFMPVSEGKWIRRRVRMDPTQVLSDGEIATLESAWNLETQWGRFGDIPASRKVDFLHEKCKEWQDPSPDKVAALPLEKVIEFARKVDAETAKSQADMMQSADDLKEWFAQYASSR